METNQLHYPRLLGYVMFGYFFIFLSFGLIRLWGFGYSIEDIGIFNQILWNSANGDWFQTSMKYPFHSNNSWLGFHFDILPIILTLPIYKIFPHIETLCVVHAALVTSVAAIIYKICRKLNFSEQHSFIWGVIYLLNPITAYHIMFSFQEISFSTPLIALGLYYVLDRKFWALFTICILLLLTKEHYGIAVFGFGILWWWYSKSRIQGILLCLLGFTGLYLVMMLITPYFSPYGEHFMISDFSDQTDYGRYQWLKQPIKKVIIQAPAIIFSEAMVGLMIGLLICFVFLPLGAVLFLFPAAADFAVIALANTPFMKSINYYYSAPFIPPLIVASVFVLSRLKRTKPKLVKPIIFVTLIINAIFFCCTLYIPVLKIELFKNSSMDWSIGKSYQDAIAKIPADGLVITDQSVGTYITNRRDISRFDVEQIFKADYAFFRISPYNFSPIITTENFMALWLIPRLAKSPRWGLIHWQYPYAVFKKGAEDTADEKQLLKEVEFYQLRNDLLDKHKKTNLPKVQYNINEKN